MVKRYNFFLYFPSLSTTSAIADLVRNAFESENDILKIGTRLGNKRI